MTASVPVTVLLISCLLAAAHGQIVKTEYGNVVGHTVTLNTGKVINSFLAVPYIKAPVGPLRFEKPQKQEKWTSDYVADKLGPACPQGGSLFIFTHPLWDTYSEDCVHMNIYAPNDTSRGPYPVMIWFHGGGYGGSANIQYPGHFLAGYDVVVVVANYRLGALGFSSTEDGVIPGNMGMFDQVMALEFIRDNIANFGGDPKKVTAFGQSAGGSSSGLHLMSPLSRDLVHQVICESGNEMAAWAVSDPDMHQEDYIKQVAEKLNCTTTSSRDMVACLRTKNANDIAKIDIEVKPGWINQGFAPIVDGPNGFLPDRPEQLRIDGKYNKRARMMSGLTSEDGSLYVAGLVPEANDGGLNRTQFLNILRDAVDYLMYNKSQYRADQAYQAVSFQYSNWPHINDLEGNRQKMNALFTDVAFGVTMDMQLRYHTEVNTTYMYRMGFRSSNAAEVVPEWMGVPHNGEVPYVFGWPLLKLNEAVRADSDIYFDIVDWNDEDMAYANYVQTMWTNFAKFGNPTPTPVPSPNGNVPTTWPAFNSTNFSFLSINRKIEYLENYRQKSFAFFREYAPWIYTHYIPKEPESSTKTQMKGIMKDNLADFSRKMKKYLNHGIKEKTKSNKISKKADKMARRPKMIMKFGKP